jgi:hypothetical protein
MESRPCRRFTAPNQSDHEANRAIGQRARPAKRYSSDMSVALEDAMKSVAKRKEEAIAKHAPKRPPTLDEMLDEALDETFRPPIRWRSPRLEDHPDAGKRNSQRERELEACPPSAPPLSRQKLGEVGRNWEKCRCVTELTARRVDRPCTPGLCAIKSSAKRSKSNPSGIRQPARAIGFLIEARHQRPKALRPFHFNTGPRHRRIRERNARSCARIAKILRTLRNFPRFAGFWFG